MIAIRRKTREAHRHDRAVVLQQVMAGLDDPRAWQAQRAIEESRMKRALRKGGGHHEAQLGVVTSESGAGGTVADPSCTYCHDQAGGCWYCGRG